MFDDLLFLSIIVFPKKKFISSFKKKKKIQPKTAMSFKKKKKKGGGGTSSIRDCSYCGATEGSVDGSPVHKVCGRCQATFYCGQE